MRNNKETKTIVDGLFFNIHVIIVDSVLIKIYNAENISFEEFKPQCDLIARYLIREGFVTTKLPRVEVISS